MEQTVSPCTPLPPIIQILMTGMYAQTYVCTYKQVHTKPYRLDVMKSAHIYVVPTG